MNSLTLPRLICLFGAATIGGFGMYFIILRNTEPVIRLDDATSADLGPIPLQVPTTRTLKLFNDSREIVRVARISASCGCTSIEPQQFQINPGESAKFDVTLDPMSLENGKDIPRRHRLGLQLMVVIDQPRSKAFRFPLEATIESVLSSFPQVAGFESSSNDVVTGTLEVVSHEPLDRLDVLTTNESIFTHTEPAGDGRHFQVHVRATCSQPETKSARLELRPVTQSGATTSPYITNVYVTRSPDVRCAESFINFGVLESGASQSRSLRLISMSQRPFKITGHRWEPEKSSLQSTIQISPATSDVACEAGFTVSARLGDAGDHSGDAVFLVSQGDLEYSVTVPVLLHARQAILVMKEK